MIWEIQDLTFQWRKLQDSGEPAVLSFLGLGELRDELPAADGIQGNGRGCGGCLAGAMRGSAGSASGVRGCRGSPVFDAQLYARRESRVVTCYVPGEEPALVVVPAELKEVLVSWQRWALWLVV